jgi:sugar phosphate isomerase/epimerase
MTSIALSLEETGFGPVLFGGNLRKGIRLAAELGFSAVELSIRDPNQVDRQGLRRLLADVGLTVSGIATGQSYYGDGLSLTDPDPEKRDICLKRLKGHIDVAGEYGALVIIGGIRGALVKDPDDRAIQEAAFRVSLLVLADYARKAGVTLAIEPINRYETNMINTVCEGLATLASLKQENVVLLVDTFHMNIEEARIGASIHQAGTAVGYVHIADSNRWAPGLGHIDFGEVLGALDDIGYGGPISAEVLPIPTPEEAIGLVGGFWEEQRYRYRW